MTIGSDYINANYIKGFGKSLYIAGQAPISNTLIDFWRMIYEQRSHLLVMLTKLEENRQKKALRCEYPCSLPSPLLCDGNIVHDCVILGTGQNQ